MSLVAYDGMSMGSDSSFTGASSNVAEYSVSEISGALKRTVEIRSGMCACAAKFPAIEVRIRRGMPISH